ncbi:hypothetical protein [Virgibacillus byunsanensis]
MRITFVLLCIYTVFLFILMEKDEFVELKKGSIAILVILEWRHYHEH